jgi:hypothetical protein
VDYIQIYKTEVPNAKITLDKPVVIEDIYNKINGLSVKMALQKLLPLERLYFWDFGVRASKELKEGVDATIICRLKKYDCKIIVTINDPGGELGDVLGWVRQFHTPWKNVCALKILNIEEITPQNLQALKDNSVKITKSFYKVENCQKQDNVERKSQSNKAQEKEHSVEENSVCDHCNKNTNVQFCHFSSNMSFFFSRHERKYYGYLCPICMTNIFLNYTITTLFLTWWGIVGMFLGPAFIISNISEYISNLLKFANHSNKSDKAV